MIGYRFLAPADEEMSQAAIFYEANSIGLGIDFLNEVQRVIDLVREYQRVGQTVGQKPETSCSSPFSLQPNLFS